MRVKIVSYFTPNYLDEVVGLRATAEELGLRVDVLQVHAMSWAEAVMMKPQFILDRVELLEDKYSGLLFTDADSRFRRIPDWERFYGVDFSCHFFQRSRVCEPEMLTGTMYFGRGPHVIPFLKDWVTKTQLFKNADTPEQKSLAACWSYWGNKLNFMDIGPEMVWIFDDFIRIYPGKSPIIEHLQASRRMRK